MTYNIDTQHSSAQFKVRHMMIANVKGEFDKLSGTVEFDPANAALSSVEAKIDVNSISTRETDRDNHLKSADFFDAAQFPEIAFKSKKVAAAGSGFKITGDLTIHGVTRPVTLSVEGPTPPQMDPWGNVRIGLEATTKIDRKDFGLTWNTALETGGILVGDTVHITIEAEFIKG